MSFLETIKQNSEKAQVKWWPNFAFHYTDVTNAVSILQSGKLYSRIKAQAAKVMKNDNASRQVIDMTMSQTTSYVRFYFRPLTPTQYYNEGFKHPAIRYDGDLNANIPVPVFFVFHLELLLKDAKVRFSNLSQAGYGSVLGKGEEDFSKLEFEKIYSNGYVDEEVRKYRHAELLYPDEYNIDDSLDAILCRNEVERATLLNLLFDLDKMAYFKYKDLIKVCKKEMFEKNGLFIDEIYFDFNSISFAFSESYDKRYYENKQLERLGVDVLEPVTIVLSMEWRNSRGIIFTKHIESTVDYRRPGVLTLKNLPQIPRAKKLAIKVKIEQNLIGYITFNLEENEII